MARSVNKVILIGTAGRDPEIRYMPNGNPVANVSLATDEGYTDKQSGQKVEQTEWHRLVAYGKLAEIFEKWVSKGSKIYVEGKLKTREWEKDGVKRYTTEIQVLDMSLCGSRPDHAGGHGSGGQSNGHPMSQPAPQQAPAAPGGYAAAPGGQFDDFDDDIPF